MKNRNIMKFDSSAIKQGFTEVSKMEILFGKSIEEYIKSVEDLLKLALEKKKLKFEADYKNSYMRVYTTRKTRDPYIIVKGKELLDLLSRGMKLEMALKVLDDEVFSEIIPARLLCKSTKVFERRRNRLLNPKILKAIKLLTKTHILVSGKTVCLVGDYRGLEDAKAIVIGCFENKHPVFEIRRLMIKKKLMEENKEGNWEIYLPQTIKTHTKKKSKGYNENSSVHIAERKEDIEKETGIYYADETNIEKDRLREERRKRNREKRESKNAIETNGSG